MSLDLEKSQKDLKFCKKMMYAFFFTSVFFCAGYIMESESFLWIEWDNTDEIEDRLIQQGRADMFMDIYPSPSTVIKMLDLGYLNYDTVPTNLKPMIDCGYINSVRGNLTNMDCYNFPIEEKPFKLPEPCFLNEELKPEC